MIPSPIHQNTLNMLSFPLLYYSASWRPKGDDSTDIKRMQHRVI